MDYFKIYKSPYFSTKMGLFSGCGGRTRTYDLRVMSEEKKDFKDKNKSAMSVASLTLGIISIVFSLFWYISIPTSIIAIIFGTKTIKKFGSRLGKAGLITGIVGISLCVFLYISAVVLIVLNVYL